MARDAGMGEAVEVGVGDGVAVHRLREVAEATGHPYFPLEYVLPIDYT